MNFSTILGVIEILRSLRLVQEEKAGKKVPKLSRLEVLEKLLELDSNQQPLSS